MLLLVYFRVQFSRTYYLSVCLSLNDQDPDYLEPARLCPRLNYSDPAASVHAPRYRGVDLCAMLLNLLLCYLFVWLVYCQIADIPSVLDSFAAGSSLYSRDYYGSDVSTHFILY